MYVYKYNIFIYLYTFSKKISTTASIKRKYMWFIETLSQT